MPNEAEIVEKIIKDITDKLNDLKMDFDSLINQVKSLQNVNITLRAKDDLMESIQLMIKTEMKNPLVSEKNINTSKSNATEFKPKSNFPRKRLTDEENNEIYRLIDEGKTPSEIGDMHPNQRKTFYEKARIYKKKKTN